MATTEEMFELRIKETCAEIRHVQSQMNAIVVRSTEDTFTGDTENSNLSQEMLFALRHYQDALFSTLNFLRRKYDNYSMSLQATLDRMGKTSVERQRLKEFPKVPTGRALDEAKENAAYIHRSDAINAQRSEPMIGTPLGQELRPVGDCCPETPNDAIRPMR